MGKREVPAREVRRRLTGRADGGRGSRDLREQHVDDTRQFLPREVVELEVSPAPMPVSERMVEHDRHLALPNQEQVVHAVEELVVLLPAQERGVRVFVDQPLRECERQTALALLLDTEKARIDERFQHQHEPHALVAGEVFAIVGMQELVQFTPPTSYMLPEPCQRLGRRQQIGIVRLKLPVQLAEASLHVRGERFHAEAILRNVAIVYPGRREAQWGEKVLLDALDNSCGDSIAVGNHLEAFAPGQMLPDHLRKDHLRIVAARHDGNAAGGRLDDR